MEENLNIGDFILCTACSGKFPCTGSIKRFENSSMSRIKVLFSIKYGTHNDGVMNKYCKLLMEDVVEYIRKGDMVPI